MFSPNYIEIYDNILSQKECDILISQFEKSELTPGLVTKGGSGERVVDTDLKVSIEKNVKFTDGSVISNIIRTRLISCIEKYKKKYEKNLNCLTPWGYNNEYTFKKFEGKDAGFKRWHTEHGPGNPLRILVWAFYANDACGTEFMNYPTVQAKRGRCVIWPAAWSHVHRSAPNKGVKYYISGWISLLYESTSQTGT